MIVVKVVSLAIDKVLLRWMQWWLRALGLASVVDIGSVAVDEYR
jgi:hypothetical protein